MERQNCKRRFEQRTFEAIESVSPTSCGLGHSRLANHNRVCRPGFLDDVCLVQLQGRQTPDCQSRVQRFRTEYCVNPEFCCRTQFSHGVPSFFWRSDSLPFPVLFSGRKSRVPRARSSVELEPAQYNHTRGDACRRDDARGGAFQFADSGTPWIAALFLFWLALLRAVSSAANVSSWGDRGHYPRARVPPDNLSVSWRRLGYLVSGDLSQSAALRQRDRDTASGPRFSCNPLPRGGVRTIEKRQPTYS